MPLPDWIDEPVSAVAMEKHHDAIGKLVVATQDLEAWLAFLAYRLGAAASYPEAARFRATQLIVKVRQAVENIPTDDRDDLRSNLRRCSAIFDFRNAVVHAMPRRYGSEVPAQEQALSPPPAEEFTNETLVGTAFAAQSIVEYLKSRVGRWPRVPMDTTSGARDG